jgi:hypothetical protein
MIVCPACNKPFDENEDIDEEAIEYCAAGSLTICGRCGSILIFDYRSDDPDGSKGLEPFSVHIPTPEEFGSIPIETRQNYATFQTWARAEIAAGRKP